MMKKRFYFVFSISFFISYVAEAYMDTPLLIQLCSNSASQLAQLEELITNAKKHTEKLENLNEKVMDKVDSAKRVIAITEDQVELSKSRPEDLESLNLLISQIKNSSANVQQLADDYRKQSAESKKEKEKALEMQEQQNKLVSFYKGSERNQAQTSGSLNDNARKTTLNTAATASETAKLNQKILDLKVASEKNNEILAKESSRKAEQEAEMRKYYGLDKKSKIIKKI